MNWIKDGYLEFFRQWRNPWNQDIFTKAFFMIIFLIIHFLLFLFLLFILLGPWQAKLIMILLGVLGWSLIQLFDAISDYLE